MCHHWQHFAEREEERRKRSLNQNTQSPSLSLQDTNCCMGTEFARVGPSFREGECLPGPLVSYKPERSLSFPGNLLATPDLCLSKTELLPPYVSWTGRELLRSLRIPLSVTPTIRRRMPCWKRVFVFTN